MRRKLRLEATALERGQVALWRLHHFGCADYLCESLGDDDLWNVLRERGARLVWDRNGFPVGGFTLSPRSDGSAMFAIVVSPLVRSGPHARALVALIERYARGLGVVELLTNGFAHDGRWLDLVTGCGYEYAVWYRKRIARSRIADRARIAARGRRRHAEPPG